jgi:myo-inositol 2-dehydrogenase/D-chiro-inositol 1-dehydrogenase
MNVLILGDGPEERSWAVSVLDRPGYHLSAAFPGFGGLEQVRRPRDLDDALAVAGIDLVVVGGAPAFRAEALRRVAAEGLPAICLHPPGPDSEAYYQVALSRAETGAVIVPDLPLRLHPGVEEMRQALERQDLGSFRSLAYEETVDVERGDLTQFHFARVVDVVRALLGDVEAVTATGDPPGEQPDLGLVVQLRCPGSRRAEVRLRAGRVEPPRLTLTGSEGSLTPDLEPWDAPGAILDVLDALKAGRPAHPDLSDGTRAMEVAEAVVRSLRRGRTVDLHYEEISEAGTFKSVMTSLGCLVLLSILVVLPVALVGPAIGLGWTIYLSYLIPPLLCAFLLLQLLRFAARGSGPES